MLPHIPLGPICTATSEHRAAACPNFVWMEEINNPSDQLAINDTEFYPVQLELLGNQYKVADLPGLGVEINEERALQQSFVPQETPKLRRQDGSITNW